MKNNSSLGITGEKLAIDYLQNKGCIILHTNYRFKKLEADIIALDNNCLVFVEVKTRTKNKFGNPENFVNKRKISNIKLLAENFISKITIYNQIRFDVIAILENKIEHFEDAF